MAMPGDPPNGTPEGAGGADDEFRSDEYRSVVFDEDFVRAARLQEFSAQERMGEHARAVRSRSIWSTGAGHPGSRGGSGGGAARQGRIIVLCIALALAGAVYMGLRNPYVPPAGDPAQAMSSTVVPLAPTEPVPGGKPADLYAHSPAAQYRVGAAGITFPAVRRTRHFTEEQVQTALTIAKDYLVQSSLDPDVLSGEASRPVRVLLDPDQLTQFDQSMLAPAGNGRHAVTGWLVRFDPATAVVADTRVRVSGVLTAAEVAPSALEVTSDHTFVYAVRPATGQPSAADGASLFTVRRELRMRFDRDDLTARRAELVSAYVMAGPQACSADPAGGFRPLMAGAGPATTGPAATDPYASGSPRRTAGLCGVLAPTAAAGTPEPPEPQGPASPAAPGQDVSPAP
ncbi:SCO2583 family membrane protein [Streptomyces sp. NPDC003952]